MPPGVDSAETEHAEKPIQREGYTNEDVDGREDHYWWVCDDCFSDFRERFGWTVKP